MTTLAPPVLASTGEPAHLVVSEGEQAPLGLPALAGLLFGELGAGRATRTMARMLESVQSVGAFLDLIAATADSPNEVPA